MAYYKVKLNIKNEWYAVMYSSGNNKAICWTEGYETYGTTLSAIEFIRANAATAKLVE